MAGGKLISPAKYAKMVAQYQAGGKVVEIAKKHKIKDDTLRMYLKRHNLLRVEDMSYKTRIKRSRATATELIKEVRRMPVTPDIVKGFRDLKEDYENLRGGLLENAMLISDKLKGYISKLNENDLKDSLLLLQYANTLKAINDAVGTFSKAPAIAIQNNIQNNNNRADEREAIRKRLEIEVKMLEKNG